LVGVTGIVGIVGVVGFVGVVGLFIASFMAFAAKAPPPKTAAIFAASIRGLDVGADVFFAAFKGVALPEPALVIDVGEVAEVGEVALDKPPVTTGFGRLCVSMSR
jgi:hypothetical protein